MRLALYCVRQTPWCDSNKSSQKDTLTWRICWLGRTLIPGRCVISISRTLKEQFAVNVRDNVLCSFSLTGVKHSHFKIQFNKSSVPLCDSKQQCLQVYLQCLLYPLFWGFISSWTAVCRHILRAAAKRSVVPPLRRPCLERYRWSLLLASWLSWDRVSSGSSTRDYYHLDLSSISSGKGSLR